MRGKKLDRRKFIKSGITLTGILGFPHIIPGSVWNPVTPSSKINLGCIGIGRMGMGDLRGFLGLKEVKIIAVCDVDRKRAQNAATHVDEHYTKITESNHNEDCDIYENFLELLERKDIDAVSISTPDHWHGIQAVMAANMGKDIFLQKPFTFTVDEGKALCDAVNRMDRILQVGSQQRSDERFRFACELVRNGRIGQLRKVEVGFGQDLPGKPEKTMPVPGTLNYDLWLGPAPWKPYTEKRVHPPNNYSRPGWMRISDYTRGMITNWGAHHIDIAHRSNTACLLGHIAMKLGKKFSWDKYNEVIVDHPGSQRLLSRPMGSPWRL